MNSEEGTSSEEELRKEADSRSEDDTTSATSGDEQRLEVAAAIMAFAGLFLLLAGLQQGASRIRVGRLLQDPDPAKWFFNLVYTNRNSSAFRDTFRIYRWHYDLLFALCSDDIPPRLGNAKEVLGVTLQWLATGESCRAQEGRFGVSFATCHSYRMHGLRAIVKNLSHLITLPTTVPGEFASKFLHFDQALFAIDGAHFPIAASQSSAERFRCRKGFTSTNVLIGCDWELNMCYVYAGVEGSAHDATVLVFSQLLQQILDDYFVLADAGYGLRPEVLIPYRGVRYHLREWAEAPNGQPQSSRELFNLRHSEARNAVERLIGILKRRFKILRVANECDMSVMKAVIFTCCCLHNFIQ